MGDLTTLTIVLPPNEFDQLEKARLAFNAAQPGLYPRGEQLDDVEGFVFMVLNGFAYGEVEIRITGDGGGTLSLRTDPDSQEDLITTFESPG